MKLYGLSPQQYREKLYASYRESYRRAQIQMTDREIAAQVLADCELVDAADRAGELYDPTPKKTTEPAAPRRDVLALAQEATGTRLNPKGEAIRPGHLYENPQKVSERWGRAVARIARITQGAGGSSSIAAAAANAEVPKLAHDFAQLWSYFMTYQRPAPATGVDHNPFRGLAPRDAARKFMRLTEDICDRSTGALGAWYVK